MQQVGSAEEAARDTHAIVVLTEWDEFKDLDFPQLYASMERPALIFDGRNLLDEERVKKAGFLYYRIGRSFGYPQ